MPLPLLLHLLSDDLFQKPSYISLPILLLSMIVSNLVALADGKEEISWEEFETEQYGFLSESHITVRTAHLQSFVKHMLLSSES